jgi:hypothetical protein
LPASKAKTGNKLGGKGMDTLSAIARRQAHKNDSIKVFDWNRAAELIKKHKPQKASAGLSQDWEWTGGTIFEDGKPITNSYTYLSSVWATPELDLDGEIFDCYKLQDDVPDWNYDTKWPESALIILNVEVPNA